MRAILWAALLGLVAVTGFLLLRQYEAAVQLSAAVELSGEHRRELAQLRAEKQRLSAAQVPVEEVKQRRERSDELQRLRAAISEYKNRGKRPSGSVLAATYVPRPLPPDHSAGMRSADTLRNAGTGSPTAVVETLCWALNGQERNALADIVALSGKAAEKADQLFANLSPEERAKYGTPERMVGFMLGGGTPVAGIEVYEEVGRNDMPDWAMAMLRVKYTDGEAAESAVISLKTPEGWRWLVPPSLIARFEPTLRGKEPFAKSAP